MIKFFMLSNNTASNCAKLKYKSIWKFGATNPITGSVLEEKKSWASKIKEKVIEN